MDTRSSGYTLAELVVVCSVLAVLAAITIPGVALQHGRTATVAAAETFTLSLRTAQAIALAQRAPVRVRLVNEGRGYVVERARAASWDCVESRSFSGARCRSNYPQDAVEFTTSGFPHATEAGARAGTFTFSSLSITRRVVLQLGGVVRCL
jgi:prepilin-type N-terminal cleavage/methylation domain-containing protein